MEEHPAPVPVSNAPGTPAAAPLQEQRSDLSLSYTGEGSEYFVIQLVNSLLALVTLGIYYPWGRARELRFLIGSLTVAAEPLTFHGFGKELFWGMLRAWLVFFLPLVVLYVVMGTAVSQPGVQTAAMLGFYVLMLVFVPFAVVGSLRYRASRTSWRGIRFGFDGRFGEFGWAYAWRLLAIVFTLGLAYPHVSTWRRRYVLEHSRFGTERFEFHGAGGDLMSRFVLCWFLLLPTLGLSMTWFHGHQQAYFWNHTGLAGGRFRSTLTGGEWVGVSLVNALLVMLTLGIGASWAYTNLHREFFSRLSLQGIDLARIHAMASTGSGVGEGVAHMLDMDGGVDIG